MDDKTVRDFEDRIRGMILDFENEHGCIVETMHLDRRPNVGLCQVEVFTDADLPQ